MVKPKKYISAVVIQVRKPFFSEALGNKKRILQGGFAEFEAVLWTALFFFLLVSFIGILDQIEKSTASQVKEFQSEWNKIKE